MKRSGQKASGSGKKRASRCSTQGVTRTSARAVELPLLGVVAAGAPIEAIVGNETIEVPESLGGKRDT